MIKEVTKRRIKMGGAWLTVIALVVAGAMGVKYQLEVKHQARKDVAITRLIGEWKDLRTERQMIRWRQNLVRANRVLADAGVDLAEAQARGNDFLARYNYDRAERKVAALEHWIDFAPTQCAPVIERTVRRWDAKLRDSGHGGLALGTEDGTYLHTLVRIDLEGAETENVEMDADGCGQWFANVYADPNVAKLRIEFLKRAGAEADDGRVRHYTIEDASDPDWHDKPDV